MLGGDVDGRRVRMFAAPESSDTGTLGAEVLCIRMALAGPVPEGLEVRRATTLGELDAVTAPDDAGGEPLRLEVPARELELEARCGDPELAESYLDGSRRRALADLVALHPSAVAGLERGEIFLRERELVADPRRLEERFAELREIASRLDEG